MKKTHACRGHIAACLMVLFTAMGGLTSCQEQPVFEDGAPTVPMFSIGDGLPHLDDDPPCQGAIAFDVDFETASAFLDYDAAIEVLGPLNSFMGLPTGCLCSEVTYCVEFAYAPAALNRVAVKKKGGQNNQVKILHVAQPTIPPQSGGNMGFTLPPANLEVCFDLSEDGEILLLDFPEGLPSNFSLYNSIVSAGGLCIVDNIPDPEG